MKFTLKEIILIGLFTALTSIFAQIAIITPFTPVPITLEILAVFLSGIILEKRCSAFSQLIFILLGITGIPVFAHFRGGLDIIIGPTGGYILSFPVMAYITGYILDKKKKISKADIILALFLSIIICYITGTLQLGLILGLDYRKAVIMGVVPFIPFDIIKAVFAGIIGYQLRKSLIKANLL